MDRLDNYRQIIKKTLSNYTRIPYAYGEIQSKVVFDRASDSYLLMTIGWNDDKRIHGCLIHIEIIDGKIWVQRDGTEYGVTRELEAAGIPKSDIVLGFQMFEVRQYTEYAVA